MPPSAITTRRTLAVRAVARRTFAAVAYLSFLAAAGWAVVFLADIGPLPTIDSPDPGPVAGAVSVDLALWLLFGLQHSLLARRSVKQSLARFAPPDLERSTFVLTTGLVLGLMLWQWRALPASIWHIDAQPWGTLIWLLYGTGWAVAVAATFITSHPEFLGLRQAGWFPRPADGPAGLTRRSMYALVRHPMMTGLLLAFWATPVMTVGHLLFALAGSGYIAIGVHFEERDLRREFGADYDEYARQVPRLLPTAVVPPSWRRSFTRH
jgi:protein-S-isoprenylcysteine O-methyltransferase Ste14